MCGRTNKMCTCSKFTSVCCMHGVFTLYSCFYIVYDWQLENLLTQAAVAIKCISSWLMLCEREQLLRSSTWGHLWPSVYTVTADWVVLCWFCRPQLSSIPDQRYSSDGWREGERGRKGHLNFPPWTLRIVVLVNSISRDGPALCPTVV